MPKRKTRRKTITKRTKTRRKTTSGGRKPIGFVKVSKGYRLVFGTKKNPKLSSTTYKTKSSLTKGASRYFK